MAFHQNFILTLKRIQKMKRNKIILVSLCFYLFQISQSFSQSTWIEYNSFVDNLIKNNPLAKRAINLITYGELNYKSARGNYDPKINGSYTNKFFNGSNYNSSLNSEIKQQIFTNQYLKFGFDYGIGNNLNPDMYTPTSGLPYFGVEVGLLQGMMIDYTRANVLKTKEYKTYYSAEHKIQLNNLLFEASTQYFDWLFSAKQLALNSYFMQIANQRLRGIESLAEIGEKATIDTIEAAIFYQSRLLDYQNSTIDFQKTNNDIASFNWSESYTPLEIINYSTSDSLDLYFNKVKNSFLKTLLIDTLNNPVLMKYNSLQKVLEIENRLKKEMIKPKLNVSYNFLSNENAPDNTVLSTNNYKWGANISFPLLLRNSLNNYKMSKINSQNNNYELMNKGNELNYKLNSLKQNITTLSEQLLNAEKTARYSKQLVDAEKIKFTNGESSLFLLNTRENKWLESELKLAEFKLKFIKTVINVIYLKGNLNYKF